METYIYAILAIIGTVLIGMHMPFIDSGRNVVWWTGMYIGLLSGFYTESGLIYLNYINWRERKW